MVSLAFMSPDPPCIPRVSPAGSSISGFHTEIIKRFDDMESCGLDHTTIDPVYSRSVKFDLQQIGHTTRIVVFSTSRQSFARPPSFQKVRIICSISAICFTSVRPSSARNIGVVVQREHLREQIKRLSVFPSFSRIWHCFAVPHRFCRSAGRE